MAFSGAHNGGIVEYDSHQKSLYAAGRTITRFNNIIAQVYYQMIFSPSRAFLEKVLFRISLVVVADVHQCKLGEYSIGLKRKPFAYAYWGIVFLSLWLLLLGPTRSAFSMKSDRQPSSTSIEEPKSLLIETFFSPQPLFLSPIRNQNWIKGIQNTTFPFI